MTLTDSQLDRYARHIVLREVGGVGQQRLLASHILMIGAGGIGCPALQYLVAAGVGTITLVDDDVVSLSNLQRQTLYGEADIGRAKVEAAAARMAALDPDIAVRPIRQRVTTDNVDALLAGVDVVLDGSDNFATRLLVGDAATRAEVPLVMGAIAQFHGQVATFRGWREDAPCYRCFVGDAHDPDDCDSCAEQGVMGAMCGLIGSFAAMEAIRAITGFGDDVTGKLHIFDGLKPGMRTVTLPKDAGCKGCGNVDNNSPSSSEEGLGW